MRSPERNEAKSAPPGWERSVRHRTQREGDGLLPLCAMAHTACPAFPDPAHARCSGSERKPPACRPACGQCERWHPQLKRVELPLGHVVYEPGSTMSHVYFPVTAIVSLLYVMENGSSAEIAVVGNKGIVGISLFMGGRRRRAAPWSKAPELPTASRRRRSRRSSTGRRCCTCCCATHRR